jgi:transposase
MLFRTRDLWVRQRTQMVNALRGHLAEFGIVAPAGHARTDRLAQAVEDDTCALPETARALARMLLEQISVLTERISTLDKEIRRAAPKDPETARLMTIPGVGAICATAVKAFCPSMTLFRNGRDFAAWVGLTPKQNSTGGKARLGRISKMGQRDIRRLLIIDASAVVCWAARKGAPKRSWLERMMARKPHMLVVVALANKMARTIWAMSVRQQDYRDPAMAA